MQKMRTNINARFRRRDIYESKWRLLGLNACHRRLRIRRIRITCNDGTTMWHYYRKGQATISLWNSIRTLYMKGRP